jgi:uncharacterized membrane protein YoaK (UPF0700 family)
LLLVLTVVTGVVDAVSILSLGRVFVANMTGNIVFVGFALAGAPGFSLSASLFALAGFLFGAFGGGELIGRGGGNRATLLRAALVVESALVVIAAVIAALVSTPFNGTVKDAIALLTAVAMGLQNAVARHLAVPDLTTTVLTMTLTGIAAELRERKGIDVIRRLLAVGTMLLGAVCGALLVLHSQPSSALGLAAGLLVVTTVLTALAARHPADWQK